MRCFRDHAAADSAPIADISAADHQRLAVTQPYCCGWRSASIHPNGATAPPHA
jgi:hypothetical protein